jgi:predicted amidohydrolase YtcJ
MGHTTNISGHIKAQLVIVNADIYTMDPSRSKARSMAIANGKIIHVGLNHETSPYIAPGFTEVLDLQGKFVMPGFVESHGHLLGIGRLNDNLNPTGLRSLDDVLNLVREQAKTKPQHEWIIGRGWDQNLWPTSPQFPHARDLDQVAPDHPVAITRVDGHAMWVNTRAMEKAGIYKDTPPPIGGLIERDDAGNVTGILIDNAMELINAVKPKPHRVQEKSYLIKGIQECLKLGITTFHDACCSAMAYELMDELRQERKLPLRLYTMADGQDKNLLDKILSEGPKNWESDFLLSQMAIKLYADGALGSCGAALHEDYCHRHGNKGLMLLSEDEIFEVTKNALTKGIQVCTHAIGDRANTIVINAYERALKLFPQGHGKKARLRIEHAELLRPQDIPRMAKLGIIASVQPTHCTSDMPWIEERLGEARALKLASPWRDLMNAGVTIASGSDAPIESLNPLWGLYSAITRQDHFGHPPDGWGPKQKLTLEETLETFTINGAYASFSEREIGSLQTGKWADFIIFPENPFHLRPQEFLELKPASTFVAGQKVYDSQGWFF